MISRQKAREIALKYLGKQFSGVLAVEDSLPEYVHINVNVPLKDLWFIPVSDNVSCTGGGRMICISKKTGKVVYDGADGGE